MKIEKGLTSMFNNVSRGFTSEVARLETVSENIANANQVAGEGEALYKRKSVDNSKAKGPFGSLLKDMKTSLRTSDRGHVMGVRKKSKLWQGEAWPAAKILEHEGERITYDPTHPKADKHGYVRSPDVNVVQEMVDMIAATRSYEANATVLTSAKQIAKRTLEI